MIRGFGWFGNREGFGAVSGSEILDSLYRSESQNRPVRRPSVEVSCRVLKTPYRVFGTIETAARRTGIQSANKL